MSTARPPEMPFAFNPGTGTGEISCQGTEPTAPTPTSKTVAARTETATEVSPLTTPQKQRRRALVVPREHGAWGMLLLPLITGAAVGLFAGGHLFPVCFLIATVLAVFWLRTPAESWFGSAALRARTPEEIRLVRNVTLALLCVAIASVMALFRWADGIDLVPISIIAGVAFWAQTILKKIGRDARMFAEVLGAVVLTSTAPAAYCVVAGKLDATAWILWLLNWLVAGDQIHFVWLRLRGARAAGCREKLAAGWTFLAGQFLLIALLMTMYRFDALPALAALAFVPILLRGCAWFVCKPQPIAIRRLGWTELSQALLFAAILTASYGFHKF